MLLVDDRNLVGIQEAEEVPQLHIPIEQIGAW